MSDSLCETDSGEMCKGLERHLGDGGSLPVEEEGFKDDDWKSMQVHLTTLWPSNERAA